MPSLPQLIAMGGERVGPTQGWSLLDASDATFEGVGADQSSLRKAILVGERIFDLVAFFGAHPPPFRLVREVDGILATVRIDVSLGARGDRLEQFFTSADAVRIQKDMRREAFELRAPLDDAGRAGGLPAHVPRRGVSLDDARDILAAAVLVLAVLAAVRAAWSP